MRNVNSRVPDPNSFYTSSGDTYHVKYDVKLQKNGTLLLIPSDKEDIQAKINSYREQTDMAYIIRQLTLGDTSVLRDGAMYGDFTQMPKSAQEAMQLFIDAEKAFYDLDLETRQKFDNNYRKWMIDAGSPDWIEKMNIKTVDQEGDKKNESENI